MVRMIPFAILFGAAWLAIGAEPPAVPLPTVNPRAALEPPPPGAPIPAVIPARVEATHPQALPAVSGMAVAPAGYQTFVEGALPVPAASNAGRDSVAVLQARLDGKNAAVRMAEIDVRAAKLKLARMKLKEAPSDDVEDAKLGLEKFVAQLDLRKAEAREVEVQLDEQKAMAAPPPPGALAPPGAPVVIIRRGYNYPYGW